MERIVFSTGNLYMEFSPVNGALTCLKAEETGWVIHRRAELGLSWRLFVPITSELKNNPVRGEKQKLSSFEQGDGFVRFTWKNVESDRAGQLDIDVTTEVRAENGEAVWRTTVTNRSPYTVESAETFTIGDLTAPEDDKTLTAWQMDYATGGSFAITPVFGGNKGDWGIEHPTIYTAPAPYNPFILIRNGSQGLYVGVKDAKRELVDFTFELLPGFVCAMDNAVPPTGEIDGLPVHIRFSPVELCYIESGAETALTPVAIKAYRGDNTDGVKIRQEYRASYEKPHRRPAWVEEPHSWLQVQMNSSADELRYRFTDLPRIAADCVKNGVTAIQLVGWNRGGQDQGNPCHDPDPRLGTVGEFKKALAECRAMGVKMILFSKFTWADMGEPSFEKEYRRLAVKDPWGNINIHGGYQYFLPSQYVGLSTKRLIPMCFGSEEWLDICVREFKKVVSYGCDGILYDECQHHNWALMCFDKSHGHKAGWCTWKNDNELIRRFREVEGVTDDFLFAGEACYDMEYEQYDFCYFRSRARSHDPAQRLVRPDLPMATAVCGFDERNMVGQCLKDRYIISYEPYYFKGIPSDIPRTVAYGRKMDALRLKERRYLWDGRFMGTNGTSVRDENGAACTTFSRFEAKDGTSALVICNYTDAPVTLTAALDRGTLSQYATIDDDTFVPFDGRLTLAPRSTAVIK